MTPFDLIEPFACELTRQILREGWNRAIEQDCDTPWLFAKAYLIEVFSDDETLHYESLMMEGEDDQ